MKTGDRLLDYPSEHGLEPTTVEAADGTRLRVLSAGDPSHPPLVCVHGFPQNAACWRALLPHVRDRFRVHLMDLRGYGKSELARSGDYSVPTLVDDVVRVIQSTGRAKVHLVSHDWGGPIAWGLVASRPELIAHHTSVNGPHMAVYRKQLLSNPEQLKSAWYTVLFQIPFVEHWLSSNGAGSLARSLRASSRRGTFTDEDLELYLAPMRDPARLRAALSYYRAGFKRLFGKKDPAAAAFERRIDVPTIIVWGEKDLALRPEIARGALEYCPAAELRFLPDGSHWLPDERPDEVAQAALDGLSRAAA